MAHAITDDDRKHLEEALGLALLEIWQGAAQDALDQLGLAEQQFHATPEMIARLNAEAADVARTVQEGINTRLETVGRDGTTLDDVQSEVESYNQMVLTKYLTSFASGAALLDVLGATQSSDDPTKSMRDTTLFNWIQTKDWPDECEEAAAMSPASYDDLMAVTNRPPPVHRRCGCYLEVAQ